MDFIGFRTTRNRIWYETNTNAVKFSTLLFFASMIGSPLHGETKTEFDTLLVYEKWGL